MYIEATLEHLTGRATAGSEEVALFALGEQSVRDLLGTIVRLAPVVMPVLAGASVTLAGQGRRLYETTSASSEQIRQVDESQYHSGSGPGVEAILTGAEVKAVIPASGWPDFSAAAEQASFRFVWCLPLGLRDSAPGALNLYSTDTAPWNGASPEPARALARQAAAVVLGAMALASSEHTNATLRLALDTRTVIGQAQGVLMARQSISPDEAFDVLRRASQRTNRKLRDVAAEIVEGVSRTRGVQGG